MRPKFLSGQRIKLSLNGDGFAFGTVLDYTIDTQVSESFGIDSVLPVELHPEKLRVSMTMRVFRTVKNDPVRNSVFPVGLKSEDLQEDFASLEYLTVEVKDRLTDLTIMFIPRALLSSRSASVDAEGLMMETWTILGIGFMGNELGSNNVFNSFD